MKPTNEQLKVIQTENQALIVEAGAGTGKTWALVQRFIHLLEEHQDWPLESIIAITFTIKAAREMRSRVRQAIEERARNASPGSPWTQHRLDLDNLQISTIHSLCARILRENAIAAQIDPKFDVLDENQADLLRETAAREAIQLMVEEEHPALELLESLSIRDLRSVILNLLSERGILRMLFDELPNEEGLLDRWHKGLQTMRESLWLQQLDENENLAAALHEMPFVEIIDNEDLLADTVKLAQQGCAAIRNGEMLCALNIWQSLLFSGGRQANWGGKEAFTELKDMMKALRAAAQKMEKAGALQVIGGFDRQAAFHLQLWRKLWDLLNEVYDRLKDDEQVLDFDDLEYLTVKLLDIQPRPDRLQAFLDGIHHLMVDEFQDTNPVQTRIVTSLAPINDPGKLFTVGDAKQSIYRFRQAQVSIFNKTAQAITKETGDSPLPLSTSFRSHHRIVIALNDLFNVILRSNIGSYQDFEARPAPLTAHRDGENAPKPCVEILLLPDKDLEDKNISAEDARIAEGNWIAERILRLHDERTQVWDKDQSTYRGFEFRDAAVLFRATTDLPLYEFAFKSAGVPYLTVSGRGYYDRPEVQDLVALLHALLNPNDDLNLAAALRSPLFSLSDETLFRLRHFNQNGEYLKEPVPYRTALRLPPSTDQMAWVTRASGILEELWELTGHSNTWRLLREALDLTGYEALLAINDGGSGRQLSNVRKFMAQTRDQMDLSLGDFLAQLRDLKKREAREGEALGREPEMGAVQLMTIHAAKGLEFPVVFIADLGRQKGGSTESPYLLHDPEFGMVCKVRDEMGDWVKPVTGGYGWAKWVNDSMETAEDKRLLYVACTRAADLLILSGKCGNAQTWLPQILYAWGIDVDGEDEEVYQRNEYHLRVTRPKELPEPKFSTLVSEGKSVRVDQVPQLALPCELAERFTSMGVTTLVEMLDYEKDALTHIRPVAWSEQHPKQHEHVPGHILGNIVHYVLSYGFFDDLSDQKLIGVIRNFASQEGLRGQAHGKAINQANRMLTRLRGHPIYEEIQKAKLIKHELPFSWNSHIGHLYGVIDLLYQDQPREWHLVDWKTEYVTSEAIGEFTEKHQLQMAIYFKALSDILGVKPSVSLVCLNPAIHELELPIETLEAKWRSLG